MKEISLKCKVEKSTSEVVGTSPKESYPSFSVYENAPDELLKLSIGEEVIAKVRLSSKEIREGSPERRSVGFDVMCVMLKDKEGITKALDDVKMPKERRVSVMNKYKG
jgi:hypothetical protein